MRNSIALNLMSFYNTEFLGIKLPPMTLVVFDGYSSIHNTAFHLVSCSPWHCIAFNEWKRASHCNWWPFITLNFMALNYHQWHCWHLMAVDDLALGWSTWYRIAWNSLWKISIASVRFASSSMTIDDLFESRNTLCITRVTKLKPQITHKLSLLPNRC